MSSAQIKSAQANPREFYQYERLKVFRCGDVLPEMKATANQLTALQKGTANAERYTGKTTAQAKRIFVSRAVYAGNHAKHGRKLKKFILTYRYTDSNSLIQPETTKKHINRFLNYVRGKLKAEFYLYTLELTEKGQYHYHFMLDCNFIDRKEINNVWSLIRGDYSANAVRDIKTLYDANGAAGYAAKYFTKNQELEKCKNSGVNVGERLKGLRLWATSQNLTGCEMVTIDAKDLQIEQLHETRKISIVEDRENAEESEPAKILFEFLIGYMKANKANLYFEGYELEEYNYKNHIKQIAA